MPETILKVAGLITQYGQLTALKNISFEVFENEIIGIVGPNGSGKTTLLETIAGTLKKNQGEISLLNRRIDDLTVRQRRKRGLMLVPQENYIFPMMSVQKNLEVSGVLNSRAEVNRLIDYAGSLFPVLKDRQTQGAQALSGGQQKMLAIGIGIVSNARLLLIDEPSIGLAPKLVTKLFNTLKQIREETGKTLFLAEQNVKILRIADRIIGLEGGEVKFVEKASRLDEKSFQELYMGQ
ncbi:MAG: ATP-binding cassette domain-containing protein [bacterium]|nr:ATP-binding cassette domain-containing protein [bacterium]